MNIGKIKDILSGYGSEKGFDFVISKVRELSKNKQLKENINELIKLELSAFEKADRDGEYDFPGLIDFLKEFGSESFIESYVYAYIESDSLENKKELIRKECIRDTKANTQESEQSVRRIVDRCFSIVDEHLLSCLSKEELIQARVIIKSIEEALKQQTESIEVILQTYLNKFTTLFSLHASSTTYHTSPSPNNDKQTYLDVFTNPLFLEDEEEDENVISLADMYISPSIKGKDIKASECVKKWYNTKTKPCLLLYGNAGVGKSSLVAKILADANGITKKGKVEFAFDSSKVMAVALRNHTDKINIQLKAEEILATLFNCGSAEQLKEKLLILDGLDELCVFIPGFDGQSFLSKLSHLDYGFHILVTSREAESYFKLPNDKAGLKTEHLVWEEKQINGWLELYKCKKPNKIDWCQKFYKQFFSLETDDKRREIFCVPLILYICATSETDLKKHNNIGSIYRDAFINILLRKYIQGQKNRTELSEKEKEENLIAWQYTKELAYQMFLLNTLDLIDDDESEDRRAKGFRNAKKRTEVFLKNEYTINTSNIEIKKELAVCPFAKENEHGGITFAHKTVYEYFTALKLYEDYFAKFDSAYFKNSDNDNVAKEVMESFIEAFRYDRISDEIFPYLCEMKEAPFSTTLGYSKSEGLNYEKYEKAFVYGMENHTYANLSFKSAINEYLDPSIKKTKIYEEFNTDWFSKHISNQLSTAFANFTWFLSKHGFKNDKRKPECMLIGNFLHGSLQRAFFEGWHFEWANLKWANMEAVHFEGANLRDANLTGANLTGANLRGANLKGANLTRANLTGANLRGANLTDTNLRGANLTRANLRDAILSFTNFRGANLTGANLTGIYLKNTDLTSADLTCSDLTGANLESQNMKHTNLAEANLSEANLKKTDLSEADLTKANLSKTDLSEADLTKADLSEANLSEANLSEANLSEANLSEANLSEVKMSNINLEYANLRGANMKYADLTGADLISVNMKYINLKGANLEYANLNNSRLEVANLTEANLTGTNLKYANLKYVNLKYAILKGTDLTGVNLTDANLRYANLKGANLKSVNLRGSDLEGANLTETNLTGADFIGSKFLNELKRTTIFPNGFDPKEHGMIEVDMLGNLVKDQ